MALPNKRRFIQAMQNTPPPLEGLLLVDKPAGIDSGCIINILKKELKIKKIGHTGTLDPIASGLLVICIGRKYTRLAESIQKLPKKYYVELELGKSSETYDRSGVICSEDFFNDITFELDSLIPTGKVTQKVPYYSALKKDGKTLREHALDGNFIERFNEIEIHGWETIANNAGKNSLAFNLTVSKGTYIRTIVENIGKKTGYGAVMKLLTRLSVGDFLKDNASSVQDIIQFSRNGHLEQYLIQNPSLD